MREFKVEVVQYKPHLVTIKLVDQEKELKVPRSQFEKRYQLGMYRVKNPEKLPKYY